jgi:hypothetical protein
MKLRVIVVVAWIAGAVVAGVKLPSIGSNGGGSLAALVPKSAAALRAEQVSARRFGFPLLSRTIVVVRNPRGRRARRQRQLVWLAERLTPGRLAGFGGIAAAIPILNTLGTLPFSREHGTTALLYLYFGPSLDAGARTRLAQRLIDTEIGHRPHEFEGVTGVTPVRLHTHAHHQRPAPVGRAGDHRAHRGGARDPLPGSGGAAGHGPRRLALPMSWPITWWRRSDDSRGSRCPQRSSRS